jgi:hypothetical protein
MLASPAGAAKSGVIPVLSRNCDASFPVTVIEASQVA